MNHSTNERAREDSNPNMKYSLFFTESIKLYGDSIGISNLTPDAAESLASDVTYRLREAVHQAGLFMSHGKRRKLTCSDMNRALKWSDVEPMFGHFDTSISQSSSKTISEPKTVPISINNTKIFTHEDVNINLNHELEKTLLGEDDEMVFDEENQVTCGFSWIAMEGKRVNDDLIDTNESECVGHEGNLMTSDLSDYYEHVTQVILSDDKELLNIALNHLSSNPNILAVYPYLISFVSRGVKKLNHDLSQLRKLLQTIKCLFMNRAFCLSSKSHVDMLIECILFCLTEPFTAVINPINDHWLIRDVAADLLAKLIMTYSENTLAGKELKHDLVQLLEKSLIDENNSFIFHYGVVMTFNSLGHQFIFKHLLPHLEKYLRYLVSFINANHVSEQLKCDALKVYGALLLVAEKIVIKYRENTCLEKNIDTTRLNGKVKPQVMYSQLVEVFGDSLTARLPCGFHVLANIYYSPRNLVLDEVNSNEELMQTGEELLDGFYENARVEEEVNSMMSVPRDDSIIDSPMSEDKECEPNDVRDDSLEIRGFNDINGKIKMTILKKKRNETTLARDRLSQLSGKAIKGKAGHSVETVFDHVKLKPNVISITKIGIKPITSSSSSKAQKAPTITCIDSKWFELSKSFPIKNITTKQLNKLLIRNSRLFSCNLFQIL